MPSKLVDLLLKGGEDWADALSASGKSEQEVDEAVLRRLRLCRPGTSIPISNNTWTMRRVKTAKGHDPVIYDGDKALRTRVIRGGERNGDSYMTVRVWY